MTQKQKLIVALFGEGWSIAQIAGECGVDPKTTEAALRLALIGGKP